VASGGVVKRTFTLSLWLIPLLATGSGLILVLLQLHQGNSTLPAQVNASTVEAVRHPPVASPTGVSTPNLGPRHQLSYEQWVKILRKEAQVTAERAPDNLMVMAGDSLSLWFPTQLLPTKATWLNQGISGETSYGLLQRLRLFDRTQPTVIFVMIGINDLIQGVSEATLLANQQEIVRHLKKAHPQARIVVQSILPHGGDQVRSRYGWTTSHDARSDPDGHRPLPAWVNRLPKIPNTYIRDLNREIAQIAREEKVNYLDLHPLFVDATGNILTELSTDGLHLSLEGYAVWRSQLEKFSHASGGFGQVDLPSDQASP